MPVVTVVEIAETAVSRSIPTNISLMYVQIFDTSAFIVIPRPDMMVATLIASVDIFVVSISATIPEILSAIAEA